MKTSDKPKILDVISYLEERQREAARRLTLATDAIERTKLRDEEYRLTTLIRELEEVLAS